MPKIVDSKGWQGVMVHKENSRIWGCCAPSLGVYCPLFQDYVVASSLWVTGPVREVPHCTIDPLYDSIAYMVFKTLGEEHSVTECSVPEEWSSQLHRFESLKTQITKRQDVSTDYIKPTLVAGGSCWLFYHAGSYRHVAGSTCLNG